MATTAAPWCAVPLTCLNAGAASITWPGRLPIAGGQANGVFYRCDGQMLFGVYRDHDARSEIIEASTYAGYRAMLKAAVAAGYPHIYRIWNYLPEINREVGELEVYQSFCIGRERAFGDAPALYEALPAASAIGTRASGLWLCFAASKQAALRLSNPRQLEAYHYPRQYGPSSPAFSRAMLVRHEGAVELQISGTASIVGHESVHSRDVDGQLAETVHNLEALLQQLGIRLSDLGSNALFTVYLRRSSDFQRVARALSQVLAPDVFRLYLSGDICRRSLLLEIEGIISLPGNVLPEHPALAAN